MAPRPTKRIAKVNKPAKPKPSSSSRQTRAQFSQAVVSRTSRPHYPESARRKGNEGTAHIKLSVDANGRVVSASVSRSSGFAVLDSSALKAAKRWRFKPATSGGRPTSTQIIVPIRFKLS